MHAFITFNNGMLGMPVLWQVWVAVLVVANLIVPMFFLQRLEAQVVLGALLVSMALMTFLTDRFGFTRIVGLGHIPWVPMLAFLVASLDDIPNGDAFGIWIRAVIVLNGISLAIDALDFTRYIAGDREETVPGL